MAIDHTIPRVMAQVFDGDPQPLYAIIRDGEADEFVRARMCEIVALLVIRGELPRAEAARFLRECFSDLRPRLENAVWDGWQCGIRPAGAVFRGTRAADRDQMAALRLRSTAGTGWWSARGRWCWSGRGRR